jgi:hypothetical protein
LGSQYTFGTQFLVEFSGRILATVFDLNSLRLNLIIDGTKSLTELCVTLTINRNELFDIFINPTLLYSLLCISAYLREISTLESHPIARFGIRHF